LAWTALAVVDVERDGALSAAAVIPVAAAPAMTAPARNATTRPRTPCLEVPVVIEGLWVVMVVMDVVVRRRSDVAIGDNTPSFDEGLPIFAGGHAGSWARLSPTLRRICRKCRNESSRSCPMGAPKRAAERSLSVVGFVGRGSVEDQGLAGLYQAQYARMVPLAWLLVGSTQAAEDIVQESFLAMRTASALVMRYYLDLPTVEIATILACREGTVRSHLRPGLAKLKDVLSDIESD
jgi:hypothetical protein